MGLRDDPQLDKVSILLLFLMAAIVSLFCISLLTIIIRKSISLRNFKVYRVFLFILLYIIARLLLCGILLTEIMIGLPDNWANLSGNEVELIFKDSMILG